VERGIGVRRLPGVAGRADVLELHGDAAPGAVHGVDDASPPRQGGVAEDRETLPCWPADRWST
jgi:hypothetical protein